jgi:hypothetical protein
MRRGAGGGARWNPAPFQGADQVLVAFRELKKGGKRDEHWLNTWAAWLSSKRGTKHGRLCHVELLMQLNQGQWYRFGIVKKSYMGNDAEGKPIFEWGSVHARPVDTDSWDTKYVFLSLYVPRARQKVAFDFFMSQEGKPFNYWGYLLNIMLPGGIGVGEYHPRMHVEEHSWYCSQLVGAGLQAMGDDETLLTPPPAPVAKNALRAAASVACLATAALGGTLTGLLLQGVTARWAAGLAGALVGLVALMLTTGLCAALEALLSPRKSYYRQRRGPDDWRGVVGSETELHRSSPNSLYDTLVGCKGVYPSRDPYGRRMGV